MKYSMLFVAIALSCLWGGAYFIPLVAEWAKFPLFMTASTIGIFSVFAIPFGVQIDKKMKEKP